MLIIYILVKLEAYYVNGKPRDRIKDLLIHFAAMSQPEKMRFRPKFSVITESSLQTSAV